MTRLVFLGAALLAIGCSDDESETKPTKPCNTDLDCSDGTPCTADLCNDSKRCENTAVDATAQLAQVPVDCKSLMCVDGGAVVVNDDTDVPSNPCFDATCTAGTLTETPKPEGAPCMVGAGQGTCQGGQCQ